MRKWCTTTRSALYASTGSALAARVAAPDPDSWQGTKVKGTTGVRGLKPIAGVKSGNVAMGEL